MQIISGDKGVEEYLNPLMFNGNIFNMSVERRGGKLVYVFDVTDRYKDRIEREMKNKGLDFEVVKESVC